MALKSESEMIFSLKREYENLVMHLNINLKSNHHKIVAILALYTISTEEIKFVKFKL